MQRLKNLAERIVTAAAVCAAAAIDRREEAARREHEYKLWEIKRREIERRQTLEKKRWEFLKIKTQHLEEARRLEQFVSDYETKFSRTDLPSSCQKFLQWVSDQSASIRSEISPDKLASTLDKYRLMDDDTKIDSWIRLEDGTTPSMCLHQKAWR